jgi:protein involved in polysaccharide export with SLBB domain/transcription antitermination factor NusG
MECQTIITEAIRDIPRGDHAEPDHWYALYTCPRHEKRVVQQIEECRISSFLPLYRSVRRWKDRRKELELALFPGYVFVRIALKDRLRVLQLASVVRFVSCNGHPVPLPDSEMASLMNGLIRGVRAEPHPYLAVGRMVRVRYGPLAGTQGVLVRRKDKFRVVLSLSLIMRSVTKRIWKRVEIPSTKWIAIWSLFLRISLLGVRAAQIASFLKRPAQSFMSRRHVGAFHYRSLIILLGMGLGFSAAAWAQASSAYGRTTAIDQTNSRAEQEAEKLVSLSADKILDILRQEPGLLLQVKKAIVRRAFEQGRILDPKDLTDDAIFRMIREDDGTRIIATREIEDRSYVRAKPTRQEVARNLPCRQPLLAGSEALAMQPNESQEEVYWLKHYSDLDCYLTQYLPDGAAQSLYWHPQASSAPPQESYSQSQYPQQQYPVQPYTKPQSPDQAYPPAQAPSAGYRHPLELTEKQPSQDYFGMDSERSEMASIQPDELPGLTNASQTGSLPATSRSEVRAGGASGLSLPSASASTMGTSLESGSRASGLPEEARGEIQNQTRLPLQPRAPAQPRLRHRPNPYADIPSLYDLYAQYSGRSPQLKRFGEDVFRNGTGNLEQLPMDLPAGPDYVVGPGDGLTISLSGGISQRLQRVVDREGRVALPEVGAVEVSGRNLGAVQLLVQTVLRGQFRGVDADVSLSRIRTIRVYVVGDVERPGAYDVSSLSTPLNALFIAGGPTSGGSLRILRHNRGQQLIQEVDGYDLLLHGVRANMQRLQAGDTIEIPPLSGEVTVEGMVRRPAIYELRGEKSLAEVLELAGGVLPSGTLRHVDVERVESHEGRTMSRLDIPETDSEASVTRALEDFAVKDGDKIKITPILPYADKTVYLDGHVSRPGKFAYREGMKVTDLIKSYKDLLPEPSTTHAEIIRLSQPDSIPVVLAFNLGDALDGKDQDLVLKPFDTVRVFGRFDFEDPPVITVTGEVRDPGDHLTNGVAHLRDAVYLAGGTTPDALLTDAQVFRKTRDGKLRVIGVNLARALRGDAEDNIVLESTDRIFVYRDLHKLDPPTVTVEGEVARPGKYPLGDGMTAAKLVRLAGGFKRGAYTQEADLTRYDLELGSKIVSDHINVPIAAALAEQPDADVVLRDGDLLTIQQLSGWKDVGATITVTGEVLHPGTYGIQQGERLSSVIQRAGGFRGDAYPYGSVFERQQIRDLEVRNRADLIGRVQDEAANIKAIPEQNAQDVLAKQAAVQQFQATLHKLEHTEPQGRLVLHISAHVEHWANTSSDIQVRADDAIFVPKRPSVVLVDGAVYNPTGITFKPGKMLDGISGRLAAPRRARTRKVPSWCGQMARWRAGRVDCSAVEWKPRPCSREIWWWFRRK